jgi:hypothetical protein
MDNVRLITTSLLILPFSSYYLSPHYQISVTPRHLLPALQGDQPVLQTKPGLYLPGGEDQSESFGCWIFLPRPIALRSVASPQLANILVPWAKTNWSMVSTMDRVYAPSLYYLVIYR